MSRKNFKVATDDNGQTTMIKIDKTPTGKVKTIKDKEVIRKEREEQYKNFRIGALKRRAKRMGLNKEETEAKVKELIIQIESPNEYTVLIMLNPKDQKLLEQAALNEKLTWKMRGNGYMYFDADQNVLDKLREIAPPGSKIHPYAKKKPPILPVQEPKTKAKKSRTKAEKKTLAAAAKKARKTAKLKAHNDRSFAAAKRKEEKNKQKRALTKAQMLFKKRAQKASNKKSGTVVQLKAKKGSESSKKASTTKKAA